MILFNFRKVTTAGSKVGNLNTKDQKKYLNKYLELKEACMNFKESLLKGVKFEKDIKILFDENFEKQMEKSKRTSRTSRLLHKMSENLSQYKEKFDPEKAEKYSLAFKFTPEKIENNYIKRSAIDHPEISDFFNNYIIRILSAIQATSRRGMSICEVIGRNFTIDDDDDFQRVHPEVMKNAVNVGIRDEVRKVSDKAFYGCSKLKTVKLGKNCKTIGEKAFEVCRLLRKINLENVSKIEKDAFGSCVSLRNVDLKSVKTIGERAFLGCHSLTSVDLNDVETIGKFAFQSCDLLVDIDLRKIQTIGKFAFDSCSSLTKINLINIGTLDSDSFSNCKLLTQVNLENIATIGENVFGNCKLIKNVNLKNINHIGDSMFSNCELLTKINLENIVTIGKDAFEGCKSLKSVNLKNVTAIGENAFKNCVNLEKVVLPKNNKNKAEEIKEVILSQTNKYEGDIKFK